MKKYDYLIVGSGLTGAVFAHAAIQQGKRCLVVERRAHIGGNLYCEQVEDIQVHKYGAHIFHTSDRAIWDYVNQFVEFNHYRNSPVANYRGEIYNMPFNMNTFSKMWNISTPAEARAIIEEQRKEITAEPRNLEEQAISLVGRDIFEKLIKGYTEKQWGSSCKELDSSIIRRLPVRFTYDNNYFDDCYQGIPVGGYNTMLNKMLDGCDIRLNCDYNKERNSLDAVAEKTLYTGMLDEYFGYVYGQLQYRSLRFESEVLDEPNHQGVAVVNYTDAQTPYTRSIEHKHFVFGTQPKTVVTKEYPVSWQPGLEAYYPVNDETSRRLLQSYQQLAAKEKAVLFCGRLAQYQYYDMDDAIAAALELSKRELGK